MSESPISDPEKHGYQPDKKPVYNEANAIDQNLGESEVVEFKCFLFSYKYQRIGPPLSQREEMRRNQPQQVVWLNVLIPSWFVRDQWAMSVSRATRGWQYTFRLYRVLPDTADIFDQCMRGDLDRLRTTLLEEGTSIYDQSRAGHTLLHVSWVKW